MAGTGLFCGTGLGREDGETGGIGITKRNIYRIKKKYLPNQKEFAMKSLGIPSRVGGRSAGPLVPWSAGPLVRWSPGPLVRWSPGPLVLPPNLLSKATKSCTCHEICTSRPTKSCTCHEICHPSSHLHIHLPSPPTHALSRSSAALATKREPNHRRCFWEKLTTKLTKCIVSFNVVGPSSSFSPQKALPRIWPGTRYPPCPYALLSCVQGPKGTSRLNVRLRSCSLMEFISQVHQPRNAMFDASFRHARAWDGSSKHREAFHHQVWFCNCLEPSEQRTLTVNTFVFELWQAKSPRYLCSFLHWEEPKAMDCLTVFLTFLQPKTPAFTLF